MKTFALEKQNNPSGFSILLYSFKNGDYDTRVIVDCYASSNENLVARIANREAMDRINYQKHLALEA